MSEKLRILPLGGLGEIGMNCLVLEWRDEMVLIDCGIQFPDSSYAGVELLTPDLSYVKDRIQSLRGIVVTHGHDDHIGAIPFLAKAAPLTVYSTAFPRGLIQQKLGEFSGLREITFAPINPREKFTVGPFTFDPIPVQHSIIEALGFAIETPVGVLVHSGDFKHDPNEIAGKTITLDPFREWGSKGVLLLLSDSTNAERTGHTLSEIDISNSFAQILANQSSRLLIALFASNIRRVEHILWHAHELKKKVAFAGRSMHSYTKLAHDQGSLNIPPDTLVLLENSHEVNDNDLIVLLTGSQAEPRSALVRISQGIHRDFQIKNGDTVLMSSRFIPGNERAITAMIDHLYRQGAEVVYESIHQIHVSGHGFQDELLLLLDAVKPHYFVPVHGEYRHLAKHAKLARQSGVDPKNAVIIEDGQVIEIDGSHLELGEKYELQKMAVVDNQFMAGSSAEFSQRTSLAKTGIVFLALYKNGRTSKLVTPPRISTYGLLFRRGTNPEHKIEEAEFLAESIYSGSPKSPDLEERLRMELRRHFRKFTSHKPVVIVSMIDV